MLGRTHRFHGHNSLNYVYRHGVTVRNDYLSVRVVINQKRSAYRCAVVVSKKTNKSAVGRNRIRRRINELVRHSFNDQTPALDVVITVHRSEVADMPYGDLELALEALLKKAQTVAKNRSHGRATIKRQEN